MFDPGGFDEDECGAAVLRSVRDSMLGSVALSAAMKEAQVSIGGRTAWVPKALLDTGAERGNYIGAAMVERLGCTEFAPCRHRVKLGDGETVVVINRKICLDVALYDDEGTLRDPIATEFYVMPHLGEEMIIGLPEILGSYYEVFMDIIKAARRARPHQRMEGLTDLQEICQDELGRRCPDFGLLTRCAKEATTIRSWYDKHKYRVLSDPAVKLITAANADGQAVVYAESRRFGSVRCDEAVEATCDMIRDIGLGLLTAPDFNVDPHTYGDLLDPWSQPSVSCPEEDETPDPLSFSEDILHFMETSPEEAKKEYFELLDKHVSEEIRLACPRVMKLLHSPLAQAVFSPETWDGLKVPPVDVVVSEDMPKSIPARARPIRPELYENAKKEFDRLCRYFYETDKAKCTSAIASPLVIAPKATSPFIRFCGDYRRINEYITIPQQPIPIVVHELTKAAKFKVYVDLDMTNSFHQIPLADHFSQLLSVQTPWGLVRPKFLPEGVGPASGMLQSIVREVFTDFEDWTVVIFDNFLILADDYEDAANKLEKVLERCAEYGIVLKMKKSFIGVDKVTFFGYEVTHGQWRLSQTRKDAIQALPFPKSKKEMQSFLGAALFFHHHIPDYSEWSARLYETTHDDFNWDSATWTLDYKAHFVRFKTAIQDAATLYFPRYDLPWVLRCDASEHAVGAVLFQEFTTPEGELQHQPIAFTSKRFSEAAKNWDTFKREAYGIFHAVDAFHWYLRGKQFLVETDHRNLQWIEASLSPIVCRWRALLQSFQFKIRHIPGKDNRVADWLSRPSALGALSDAALKPLAPAERTLESILSEVHGGRALHYGAAHTWRRAKEKYPEATIRIEAVREWVRECPTCQKTRQTGIHGLPEQTLSLKPPHYRRTVGVDHVTVTPVDKHGNGCVILVVEHFSHFAVAYPAPGYTADAVAKALFRHYCTYGTFEQLASDPGSAFTGQVMAQLNAWLGTFHKVSLVGRHQSNGCEASAQQFLRHLRTLVLDERLYTEWSDDTVLPLINLHLQSYPTAETGGYTPLQLKYGTEDARHFSLPEALELTPGARAAEVIQRLDRNLQTVRALSLRLQTELADDRRKADGPPLTYERGDLVLFNPREQPSDHLPTKLSPNWLGPYQVIEQRKNDVTVQHVVLKSQAVVHVERLKPYIGTLQDAIRIAQHDQHQYFVVSINSYSGNPHVRSSMVFNVTFEDGTVDVPYTADLADSAQFRSYVQSQPHLFPLLFSAKQAKQEIARINKLAITSVAPGTSVWLNARFWDGKDASWFDSCELPDKVRPYLFEVKLLRFPASNHRTIVGQVPALGGLSVTLSHYDVQSLVHTVRPTPASAVVLEAGDRLQYPCLFGEGGQTA